MLMVEGEEKAITYCDSECWSFYSLCTRIKKLLTFPAFIQINMKPTQCSQCSTGSNQRGGGGLCHNNMKLLFLAIIIKGVKVKPL